MTDINDRKIQQDAVNAAGKGSSGSSIKERGQAREDDYFRRRDAELIEDMRKKSAATSTDADVCACGKSESECCKKEKDASKTACSGGSCSNCK